MLTAAAHTFICAYTKFVYTRVYIHINIYTFICFSPLKKYLKVLKVGAIKSKETSCPFSPSEYNIENDFSLARPNACPLWGGREVGREREGDRKGDGERER